MRLQIVVKSERLERHFQAIKDDGGNISSEGERLMLLGLAAGNIEKVVRAAIKDGLREAQIVVAADGPAAQPGEDARAAEALAAASGGWFDDE